MGSSGCVALIALVGLAGCDDPIGKVPLAGLDQPGEATLTLPENKQLSFGILAEEWESRGGTTRFTVEVDLLRDGQSVASRRCDGFQIKGTRVGSLDYQDSNCGLTVPTGGATAVRAKLRGGDNEPVKLEGLAIQVFQH
jgi:hypothetical protein